MLSQTWPLWGQQMATLATTYMNPSNCPLQWVRSIANSGSCVPRGGRRLRRAAHFRGVWGGHQKHRHREEDVVPVLGTLTEHVAISSIQIDNPTHERSEGVGYKKWRKRFCVYYAEANEKGGRFSWSVCLCVCELSPPSCLDLAGSSFQGMLGSYVVVHCFDLSWICWETKNFCYWVVFCDILKKLDFHPFFCPCQVH